MNFLGYLPYVTSLQTYSQTLLNILLSSLHVYYRVNLNSR